MNEHSITSNSFNQHDGGKINPKFDLSVFEKLSLEVQSKEIRPHAQLLSRLLEQFEPVNFERLANPENSSSFKLTTKHILVLCIEIVLHLAKKNGWDLCKINDVIFQFNGEFWAEIDKEEFQQFLCEAAQKMGVTEIEAKFYQFRDQLFKQFLASAYLPIPESDKDKVLVNLKNGTLEITPQGWICRPFDSSDFLTYQLSFDYSPQAKSPIFDKYLNRVLPDKERQMVLAEYLGYVFIKNGSKALKEEKILLLYGTGANGKSVFFEIINNLLGPENVSNYSLQSITNENGYYRAKLANKLLNYASELNGCWENSIFKQMVSGEPVEARLPYGQPFVLKQYSKLAFNCNELPKVNEQTYAYYRRLLPIGFDVTIPPEEQDKQLHVKIIENELSGVFNWVLEGLRRLLEHRHFSHCEAVERAVEQYKIESDTVQLYLSDQGYTPSATNEQPLKNLFEDYKVYCVEGGYKFCTRKTFTDRLKNCGYQLTRRNFGLIVFAIKKSFQ